MNYKKLRSIFSSTLAVQIIFIAVIVGAVFVFHRFYGKESSVFKNVAKNEAALFIDFDNMKKVFSGEVVGGMTVLDALNASVAAGQIELIYNVNSDNNTKVLGINNHRAGEGKQFTFYINSKKIDQSDLNKTQIRFGDKITVKLE